MSDEPTLSAATLAALKDFALQRGIVRDDDEEEGVVLDTVRDHFAVKDREENFPFKFGEIEFTLQGVKRELGQTLSSTGLTLWRAAEHLAQFCYEHPQLFTNKSVIELGAGMGVVAILIDLMKGASLVVATDGDDDTICLLEENIRRVNSNVLARKLFWGEQAFFREEYPSFNVIIAADVIYEDEHVMSLLETAFDLMDAESVFYLAYARRNIAIDKVLAAASVIGFEWGIMDAGDGMEPVYRLVRKR